MDIRLSKSQLDKFVACPRCFWLGQRFKLSQPDMISSKVWKGVERVTIAHYEAHRLAKTTPENLIGQVPEGAIPYQGGPGLIDLKSLRYWGKGLAFKVGEVLVTTALDDLLQREAGAGGTLYNVIDYKSKSKLTDVEATMDLYQTQADVFDLACNENGYHTDGTVYFDYSSPVSVEGSEPPAGPGDVGYTMQKWASQVIAVKADHERVKDLVLRAAACIEGPMPEPNITRSVVSRGANKGAEKLEGCAVCVYLIEREEVLERAKAAA